MFKFKYEVYLNDELFAESEYEGLAIIDYMTAKLCGNAELRKIYNGNKYDPVLHFTTKYNDEIGGWVEL